METKVRLNRFPSNVQVPDYLSQRLKYDDDGQQLSFEGFMSKATFDALCGLSDDDAYRRAIEVLFRDSAKSAPVVGQQRTATSPPYLAVAIGALAVACSLLAAMWIW